MVGFTPSTLIGARNSLAPLASVRNHLLLIHSRKAAAFQQLFTAYPYMSHRVSTGGVDQLGYRVVYRLLRQTGKIQRDQIGELAYL